MRPNSTVKSKANKPSNLVPIRDFSLRARSPNESSIKSARQNAKKHPEEKKELDSKFKDLAQQLSKTQGLVKNSPTCVNDLKKAFFNAFEATKKNCNFKQGKPSTDNVSQELSYLLRECELQQKIRELEEANSLYEKKIGNHAVYIGELENKVDQLINEYERTMILNQNLALELQALKQEASIIDNSNQKDNYQDLLEEMDTLRQDNHRLQNENKATRENATLLESHLKKTQVKIDNQTRKLSEETQKLKGEYQERSKQTVDLDKSMQLIEDLRKENRRLKEEIKKKAGIVQVNQENYGSKGKNKTQTIQQEQKVLRDSLENTSDHIKESFQKEIIVEYQSKINNLTQNLKKTHKELDNVKNKCVAFEDDLLRKENLEKSLRERISTLEAQVEILNHQITELNAQKQNDADLIFSLQNLKEKEQTSKCISEKKDDSLDLGVDLNFLIPKVASEAQLIKESEIEKALKEKEKEIEQERQNHKMQIEKYNMNLATLNGKVQILVKINENLTRDLEYKRYDFSNYRVVVWSVYQEVRKYLDTLKDQDLKTQNYFANSDNNTSAHLNFLTDSYCQFRAGMTYIDHLIEERKPLI